MMTRDNATQIFESLSSGVRLDTWRLLIKSGQNGMVAGEMASTLEVAPNALSFHLKAMLHAGLVSVEQEGRFKRYRANTSLMNELIAYMTEQCCIEQDQAHCEVTNSSGIC
ncbi:ArsR/SmtB family transcription factor [Psychromonas aquimarina]|uniref:ArsR/SmtB family transcription factor n=1 Tax=Psychromonas aquimarina TaxID=444919 RepID=UPI000409B0ED|nr:helix-turn-helix domain-containing protein [Psychromonas aquimarina]